MTNTELSAKIRKEIERLKLKNDSNLAGDCQFEYDVTCGYDMACEDILSFLDTLAYNELVELSSSVDNYPKNVCPPSVECERGLRESLEEPTSEELEEEIKRYGEEHQFDLPSFQNVARHFAEWQKEQDEKERAFLNGVRQSYDNTIQHLEEKMNDRYEQGKKDMKQQMMKYAVEYEVGMHGEPIQITLDKYVQRAKGIFPGDKVKLIIIPDND
jgi:hypothetical protein